MLPATNCCVPAKGLQYLQYSSLCQNYCQTIILKDNKECEKNTILKLKEKKKCQHNDTVVQCTLKYISCILGISQRDINSLMHTSL